MMIYMYMLELCDFKFHLNYRILKVVKGKKKDGISYKNHNDYLYE